MAMKHALGRGLGALIKDGVAIQPTILSQQPQAAAVSGEYVKVPTAKIRKGKLQPRKTFKDDTIAELGQSIKEQGLLSPLTVRQSGDGYELISGERRLRACQHAGVTEVTVRILNAPDEKALIMAMVENLQREDLNVIEEAEGYQLLADQYRLTQEQISQRIGKPRATVANALRLLSLPVEVKDLIVTGQLTAGHAKILAGLESAVDQVVYARKVTGEALSVHELEKDVRKIKRRPGKSKVTKPDIPESYINHLSDILHRHFGTQVRILPCRTLANGKKVRGTVQIDFYSSDDLNRILDIFGVTED